MRAGRLQTLVTLQRPVAGQADAFGATSHTWETVAQIWAEVAPISGREYFLAAEPRAATTHRVTIRRREDIKPTWRILAGAAVYQIESVRQRDPQTSELMTVEQVTL